MFNESINNNFTLTFDSSSTDKRIVNTDLDYQLDKGSSFDINGPKYLTAAHQTEARTGVSNKANNIAIFEHLDIRTYFIQISGVRYPRDAIDLEYAKKDYLNQ